MSRPGKLTPEDKQYIQDNYKTMNDTAIAYEIGVSKTTVWKYLKTRGLVRTKAEKREGLKIITKRRNPRPKCNMALMIQFAKDKGYDNATHAVRELGQREFKRLYHETRR